MNGDTEQIEITSELYENLREYCDQNGYRFVDFIEDSLETATYRDELEKLVHSEEKINERIERERVVSVQRGFLRGVMAATLAFKGNLGLSRSMTPDEMKKFIQYVPVEGGQMNLFD